MNERFREERREYLKKLAHTWLDEVLAEAEQQGWYGEFGVMLRVDRGAPIRARRVSEVEDAFKSRSQP